MPEENKPIIHVDKSVTPLKPEHHDPLTDYVKKETSIKKSKSNDELIDIRIGNPLKRITQLLEDIKEQKAFSFSLKGSLGVAGIALVIGTFGLFGGTKALCSKGIQTKIGEVRALKYLQNPDETIWDSIPYINSLVGKSVSPRIVLIDSQKTAHRLKGLPENIVIPEDKIYAATGEYDSCSQTISLSDPNNVEIVK